MIGAGTLWHAFRITVVTTQIQIKDVAGEGWIACHRVPARRCRVSKTDDSNSP